MALRNLDLRGLQDLDGGKFAAAFDHEMAAAVRDCMDRPGDKAPRKLKVEIELKPLMDHTGETTHVEIRCNVTAVVPKRKTRSYELLTGKNGKLIYNEHNPTGVDQTTIFDADAEGKAKLEKPAGSDSAPPKPEI